MLVKPKGHEAAKVVEHERAKKNLKGSEDKSIQSRVIARGEEMSRSCQDQNVFYFYLWGRNATIIIQPTNQHEEKTDKDNPIIIKGNHSQINMILKFP